MEMIIGGAYQGKTEYARKQYPQLRWSDGGSGLLFLFFHIIYLHLKSTQTC